MTEPPRRFPAPWRADKVPGGYVVRDAAGQALAYLYGRETEADARQAKVLTNDEARRIAINVARFWKLLGKRTERDWRHDRRRRTARTEKNAAGAGCFRSSSKSCLDLTDASFLSRAKGRIPCLLFIGTTPG
jgi:hypothetical protein